MKNHLFTVLSLISGLVIISFIQANAADIYIDPTYSGANGPEDGSFLRPYDSWLDFTISAGNDYRQKAGTVYDHWAILEVGAAGTDSNHIIIGAYYDNGGSPVHEDDNPNFGANCGNGVPKPNMKSGVRTLLNGSNQYIEFNSLAFIDPGPSVPVRIGSQHNSVKYCYIVDSTWGIWLNRFSGEHSDYFYIGYNYIDLGTIIDENLETTDAIKPYSGADNGVIEYNVLTGYDHIGIYPTGSSNNLIQYNRCEKGTAEAEDYCIQLQFNSNNNIIRYNYSEDAGHGVAISEGCSNNVVFANIMTCDNPTVPYNGGCFALYNQQTDSSRNMSNNSIYNNTIYESDYKEYNSGIGFYCGPSVTSTMQDNRFYNNLISKVNIGMTFGDDCGGRDGTDTFYNNLIYDWDNVTKYYARFLPSGGTHNSANSLNGMSFAQDNRDTDPYLSDPANNQFWPLSNSPAIGNGYDTGEDYDDLIDPNNSDLYANPMQITTIDWDNIEGPYIGAFSRIGEPPVNLAPIVNAGIDQSITLPASAVLNGTVSDDGLPNPPATVTTTWTKQSGPGTVTFGNANTVDTTASFSQAGAYVLRLTADDSDLQTSDDITITVYEDTTPPAKPTGLEIIE